MIIVCWQETVSNRWKSCPERWFDKRLTYVDCHPSRHWRATSPPSENDTCRVHFIVLSAHILWLQCLTCAYNRIPRTIFLKTGWSACDMTSFSINSILDLQETKNGSPQTSRAHKSTFAFQEEIEEQTEYSDGRRSPNTSSSLDREDKLTSYEGKL